VYSINPCDIKIGATKSDEMYTYKVNLEVLDKMTQVSDVSHGPFIHNYNNFQYFVVGDSFTQYNGLKFTTRDQDNDPYRGLNCAVDRRGAWWYRKCSYSNLNGYYVGSPLSAYKYVVWYHWKNNKESLKGTAMLIRPRN
jgi:hypothetical protein